MVVQSYSQSYEQELLALWNQTLCVDQINEKIFHEQVLFDENFDPAFCLLAIEEHKLIGFLLGMKRKIAYLDRGLESDRAWICAMGVHSAYQRKKIATSLIKEIEARMKKAGAKMITLGANSPNYFFCGIDSEAYANAIKMFTSLGYTIHDEAVSMQRSLFDFQRSKQILTRKEEAEKKGFCFEKFSYHYSIKLLDFIGEEFGGGWKKNALGVLQKGEGLQNIWIVIDKEDNVVGFCMRKMDGYEHRFGPFGVKETLRSHGLGSILFELMMEDMKQHKIYQLYFLWTHGAGMKFYERHGVEVYRHFLLGNKQIGDTV